MSPAPRFERGAGEKEKAMSADTPLEPGAPRKTPGRTALVVDDSPMDRLLASSLLQNLGAWTVLTANNGVEALSILKGQTPDLVLTDLQMPEMDGLQLVQQV